VVITIPVPCLVLLVGASGAGKTTFAARHFKPTEVLSSDFFRGMLSDDETNQSCSADAFDLLHLIAERRLARRRLVVVDATNVQPMWRRPLLDIAQRHRAPAIAIVLDLPPAECLRRNACRPDRLFGPHVVRSHVRDLRVSLDGMHLEGFAAVHVLSSADEVDALQLSRQPHASAR
jgi:protein phosphatase